MRLWYRFWRFVGMLYFRFYHKLECYHRERVPMTGPVVIAPNHLSYLDPPLVGGCAPRELYYLGRKSLFRYWWSSFILRSVNVIPIDLEGGGAAGVKAVVRQLERGNAVMMFPEGTRSDDGQLGDPQIGVGWIILRTGAPVLPVRVWGTNVGLPKKGKGRRAYLEVKFGRLLRFDRSQLPENKREASELISRTIMREIEALQPSWDSGLPAAEGR
jgi:1-acyl-sn-glycerol-3-phosphate acyltransferase